MCVGVFGVITISVWWWFARRYVSDMPSSEEILIDVRGVSYAVVILRLCIRMLFVHVIRTRS